MPSAIAARVADRASSTRCCSSASSALVGAPTLITATLPDSDTDPLAEHVLVDAERRPLQLGTQLGDPELDLSADPAPSMIVGPVRGDPHLPGAAELLERHRLEAEAGVLAVDLTAGDGGDVLELAQPPVAEPGRLGRDALEHAVDVVVHQHAQRRALDGLGDDHQRSGARITLSSSGISCWTLVIFSLHSRM